MIGKTQYKKYSLVLFPFIKLAHSSHCEQTITSIVAKDDSDKGGAVYKLNKRLCPPRKCAKHILFYLRIGRLSRFDFKRKINQNIFIVSGHTL